MTPRRQEQRSLASGSKEAQLAGSGLSNRGLLDMNRHGSSDRLATHRCRSERNAKSRCCWLLGYVDDWLDSGWSCRRDRRDGVVEEMDRSSTRIGESVSKSHRFGLRYWSFYFLHLHQQHTHSNGLLFPEQITQNGPICVNTIVNHPTKTEKQE